MDFSSHLGVAVSAWLALPELALWGSGCVAVVGGGTKRLFFLVVLHEHELNQQREEEEDSGI